jgi:hypothetical protein
MISGRTKHLATSSVRASGRTTVAPISNGRPSGRTNPPANSSDLSSGPDPYALLLLYGDLLDDVEATRIANENRLRSLLSGEEWGKGANPDSIEVRVIQDAIAGLQVIEHGLALQLKRILRTTPLAQWQKATVGIGERQLARLLAVIGDPATRPNVAKLWAFCGHGDPTRRRSRGMTQEEARALGNPKAKSRTFLLAESCMKQRHSPYRRVYEGAREKYADRAHSEPCKRCGPSGNPAVEGSPWSAAHQHAAALRLVGKTILRDMWVEARRERAMPGPESKQDTPAPGEALG